MEKILRRLSRRQLFILCVVLLVGAALYQLLGPAEAPAAPTAAPATSLPSQVAPTAAAPSALPGTPAAPTASKPPAQPSATPARQPSATAAAEKMSPFDYFVLALSWSPDYCATSGGSDVQQCSIGRKLGFVLHGLWPQNNQGYPSNCTSEKMPQSLKSQFAGLYPNDALFDHEWEKHGTCTGLTPARYLALSRQLKEAVTVPPAYRAPETAFRTTTAQLVADFAKANPGFPAAAFEANCEGSGRYLQEVYVCYTRAGQPQACGSEVHKDALKSCQNADFLVRSVR